MCFVDFSKGFDTVIHDFVWYKEIESRVRHFDGTLSEPFVCYTGVWQGESLSPFLFACLLHDFEGHLKRTCKQPKVVWDKLVIVLLAFADDCVCIAKTKEGKVKKSWQN